MRNAEEIESYKLKINLENQTIADESGFETSFGVNEFRCHCPLGGLDDIELTMKRENEINRFEQTRRTFLF